MIKSKLTKNGMINFPADLRKKWNLQPGDEISFIETEDGVLIVPVKDLFDLINSDERSLAKEIVEELHRERQLGR